MTVSMPSTITSKTATGGCTQPYSFVDVRQSIVGIKEAGKSFRQIAKEQYDNLVTHAVIQRVYQGHEPREAHIRDALGLPAYHQVVVITPGVDVPPGTQVVSASLCACGQWYVSNHPARKRCFICSPYRKTARIRS